MSAAMAALLLDRKQAAALLGISVRTFLRIVERGQAPAPVRLGRLTRWKLTDLEAFVADLANPSSSKEAHDGEQR